MSFSYSEVLTNAAASCFEPLLGDPVDPILPSDTSKAPRLLWGSDPYLLSLLLSGIASEAANRRRPIRAIYDPLLPTRLTALSVEGVGSFTLSLQALSREGGLIDCTLPPAQDSSESIRLAETLAVHRRALADEIASLGRVIAENSALLSAVAARIADRAAMQKRAERLARQIPRGDGSTATMAVGSRGKDGTILRLPFSTDTKIIGLSGTYSLSALFLADLSAAIADRGCRRVHLTSALTGEVLGIWLPQCSLCYLTDAPTERRDRQLNLRRFLLPHTREERRAWRNLAVAAGALERHLDRRLAEYRTAADEEEALRSSLYTASRLQNFRKRLLIDLFCS